jgi:hypothetical protein
MFVTGGGMLGAPQKDFSTGERGNDERKISTKCRKVDPTQPILNISHYFFAQSSIF